MALPQGPLSPGGLDPDEWVTEGQVRAEEDQEIYFLLSKSLSVKVNLKVIGDNRESCNLGDWVK